MAGTVSAASLDASVQQQVANATETYRREQEERDRIAREEIAREAEARRKAQEEAEQKRKEEEERLRREKEEREEKERFQREQIERVSRQAKELEERLERLATSMPPQTAAVLDPEVTQVHQGVVTDAAGGNSFPGVKPLGLPRQPMVVEVPVDSRTGKSPALKIGALALLVLLVGGGIGGYFFLRPSVTTTPPKSTNNPLKELPIIKAEQVEIPGGTFTMGRDVGPPWQMPSHPVKVQTFFMDKTEVTNAEYAEFVREANYSPPTHWAERRPPIGLELWPVVNVSFEDANAFAKWRSKRDGRSYRLPTEEEWEFAARNGVQSDLYPWGNEWKDKVAVLKETTPAPVGSHPAGANLWGVQDLIGNAWEWTSSKVSAYPGNALTEIPTSMQDRITIRGGGYITDPADKNNPVSSCLREFFPPANRSPLLGFRLVRSGS
jgi:formylglycine-generating enzyme required for sulfatase activity